MAENCLRTPSAFIISGNCGQEWKRWKQGFKIFLEASQQPKWTEAKKVSLLLNLAGDDCIEIYNNFDQTKVSTLNEVLDQFDSYFEPRKNVVFEGFKFFTRNQQENEPIDRYLTALRTQLKRCEVDCLSGTDLTDRLLLHQVVSGIQDTEARERLLSKPNLKLSEAIEYCRGREESRIQIQEFQRKNVSQEVAEVKFQDQRSSKPSMKCSRCNFLHPNKRCYALGKTCTKCGRRNHFASVCKSVHSVQDEPKDEAQPRAENVESINLELNAIDSDDKTWKHELMVEGSPITFKLDTGAQVNALPICLYNKLNKGELMQTSKVLRSYSGHTIPVVGTCKLKVQQTTPSSCDQELEFCVIEDKNPKNAILGLKACESLNLIKLICDLKLEDVFEKYPDVFNDSELGQLPTTYDIKLKENAEPKIHAARVIPQAIKEQVRQELIRLENMGIIKKVTEPTEWVHPIVVAHKPNGSVRICMDPRAMNPYVKREHLHVPTQESILSDIAGSKYFTVLDATSAFLQIPLTEASSKLCTIATPFGRYRYLRLPFGIASASEVFQRAMNDLFLGIKGVVCYIDDILIHAKDKEEHDEILEKVLKIAQRAGLKLSKEKSQIGKECITYLGHVISSSGVTIGHDKVKAIKDFPTPRNKGELQSFLGIINYLGKFIPKLSPKTQILRDLLKIKNEFLWDSNHEKVFNSLKDDIIEAPVLQFFDPKKPSVLQVDASQYGIGATLLQSGLPVAYASATLSETQQRYSQIEKELLSIVFGCEKFSNYLYFTKFTIENDHKPLVGLLKKPISSLSPRLQKMVLKLMKYQFVLKHVPGKQMYLADALSRAPLTESVDTQELEGWSLNMFMIATASEEMLKEYERLTNEDHPLSQVKEFVLNGWPKQKSLCPKEVQDYYDHRTEIMLQEGILFYNNRIIVPPPKRQNVLSQLHFSHQGVVACKKKAKLNVFWPGMMKQIEAHILSCPHCLKFSKSNNTEPMTKRSIPGLPWQDIAADFMHVNKQDYLVIVDYYSKFVEVKKLNSKTASAVITSFQQVFRTHGIPWRIFSDGGPPFNSAEYRNFLRDYDIQPVISSPKFPRSNGMVERTIQTIKNLIMKAASEKKDPNISILDYNSTPKEDLPSPAEMLMGRKLRTLVPCHRDVLRPLHDNAENLQNLRKLQDKNKFYHDRAGYRPLTPLKKEQEVYIKEGTRKWEKGVVEDVCPEPNSYIVRKEDGSVLRRTRNHLRPIKGKRGTCNILGTVSTLPSQRKNK